MLRGATCKRDRSDVTIIIMEVSLANVHYDNY